MQRIRFFVEITTNGLANIILAHHQVHFVIAYALNGLNISWFFLYADATGDDTPRISSEACFVPSMPMTKVLIQNL